MPCRRISRAGRAALPGARQRAVNGAADHGCGKSAVGNRSGANSGTKAEGDFFRWDEAGLTRP